MSSRPPARTPSSKKLSPRASASRGTAPRVSSARLLVGEPPFGYSAGRTQAQKAGLRYEKKVLAYLRSGFPTTLLSPWIEYGNNAPYSCLCQPDAIHFHPKAEIATIIEVKYSHTKEAYSQLALKYFPVLRHLISSRWRINLLEFTRSVDPSIRFPVPLVFVDELEHFFSTPSDDIGVYTWKN